jgi:aldehyde dehydrogenase (NAD+)
MFLWRAGAGVSFVHPRADFGLAILQSVSFGGGAVNQTNVFLFIESMPYGGVGSSGIGNYYGKYGYDSLTHAKSILISPPDVAIDHLFPPYTNDKVQALNQWFDY